MGKTALLGAARPPHSISNGINLAGAVGVTREFDFGENRLRRRDMRNVVQPFVTALSTDATQSNERVYGADEAFHVEHAGSIHRRGSDHVPRLENAAAQKKFL